MHPTQQHGRRMPPFNFEIALFIRMILVSAFLPEITQQIHSLRASGVTLSQVVLAPLLKAIAFRKSAGILCGKFLPIVII